MGVVKDSLPPVPEDKEVRAKNRARNEEQKKAKEDKKAKAARKAQQREISAKNHREAEKPRRRGSPRLPLPRPRSRRWRAEEITPTGSTSWRRRMT